jgi:hypothetical protein
MFHNGRNGNAIISQSPQIPIKPKSRQMKTRISLLGQLSFAPADTEPKKTAQIIAHDLVHNSTRSVDLRGVRATIENPTLSVSKTQTNYMPMRFVLIGLAA